MISPSVSQVDGATASVLPSVVPVSAVDSSAVSMDSRGTILMVDVSTGDVVETSVDKRSLDSMLTNWNGML